MYKREAFKIDDFQKIAANATKYNWHNSNEMRSYEEVPKVFSGDFQREALHGYFACVSYIDAQVGLLINQLKKLKLEQSTIIVFWGDHGFHLGDHAMWGKHTNLEQAAIVPLIIKVPGKSSGIKVQSTAGLIDIFPTLCEAAGINIPEDIQGKSLYPIIEGKTDKVREGIITAFKSKGALGYSFRTARYRYIEWIGKSGKVEGRDLYDYQKDPKEKVNRAGLMEYKELVKKLSDLLRKEGNGNKRLFQVQAKK